MSFLRSLINLSLGALGGLLGNLLAAWILQDAWANLITPARLLATVAGFVLVILLMAWIDSRAPRPEAAGAAGEIKGNVQIGESIIRVLQGTNVTWNLQIGKNHIEVVQAPHSQPPAADPPPGAPKASKEAGARHKPKS